MAREMATEHPRWDLPTYSAAEAGRLVGLHPSRIRRWLRGYDYRYAANVRYQRPVIRRRGARLGTYASFLDLIDLLFVKRFLDHGVSLQRIRRALDEASEILGTDHFARSNFFTDGREIYVEVREQGDAILQLLSGGQRVIAPLIRKLAEQIEFDGETGLARRWYPLGPGTRVVLDPCIAFGHPALLGRRTLTANVYDFYRAERCSLERTCEWLELDPEEVRAAVAFEERIAA
jgi:DNA-binding transcriptional MerR regulator/uncharacterized protein (DUF433 family)